MCPFLHFAILAFLHGIKGTRQHLHRTGFGKLRNEEIKKLVLLMCNCIAACQVHGLQLSANNRPPMD
ncbi:hypothetical protein GQ55_7G120200 [Panicum hallii var. hallii]|uniref:Uncharacterized protein n=1 Tax=Panicum hallii var. hallii TaxID=1504633 RepID=A0A2T7CU78_9POAL|nr:hypothetical protein GQ55_7G120200 [Panicum hallii var. hallii]